MLGNESIGTPCRCDDYWGWRVPSILSRESMYSSHGIVSTAAPQPDFAFMCVREKKKIDCKIESPPSVLLLFQLYDSQQQQQSQVLADNLPSISFQSFFLPYYHLKSQWDASPRIDLLSVPSGEKKMSKLWITLFPQQRSKIQLSALSIPIFLSQKSYFWGNPIWLVLSHVRGAKWGKII